MTLRLDESENASVAELAERARQAVTALATRPDLDAFHELLDLSTVVGDSLGESARLLASHGSWSQVAEATGTTRQAAWSRWSS